MAAGAAGTRAVLALLVLCSMAAGAAGTSTDRAGAGRDGSGPGGLHSGGPGWRGVRGAHWGAPWGAGRRDVLRGLRGALAGSRPRGWAPGRVRQRRARGEERRCGRLRRGTSAAGGAGPGERRRPGALGGWPGRAGLRSALGQSRGSGGGCPGAPAHPFTGARRCLQPRGAVFSLGKPRSLFPAAASQVSAAAEQQRVPEL